MINITDVIVNARRLCIFNHVFRPKVLEMAMIEICIKRKNVAPMTKDFFLMKEQNLICDNC